MKNPPASTQVASGDELALSLTDLPHLFTPPRVDPLSRSPAEVLGVSGMDYLLSLLYMRRKGHCPRTVMLVLPAQKASAVRSGEVKQALHRQAQGRIEQLRLELRNNARYGWRVAGFAVILLALCLAISSVFASELTEGMRPHLRTTLEYSFEIVGWVLLWHPIEVLVFTPLPLRYRIRALRALMAADIVVRPQEDLKQHDST